ncbi:MAG: signal peptide peptidase SppA [Candidatus Aegiribacteria sp.]|nr:signal peptide peptidase SppA [Candidatus Aegiribacteria sp.]
MKPISFIFVLVLFSSIAAAAAAPGPDEVFNWVAYPEVGNPELINPAGYNFINSLRLRVGMAASDSAFEGFDRLSIAFPGAGLSGWWNDDYDMRRFTLSSGTYLFDRIASVGVGYTWFDPTVNGNQWSGKHFFTLGLIVRPVEWFSFGLVRQGGIDLPGDDVETVYRAGFAVRPFGNTLTLVTDFETERDLDNGQFTGGIEFHAMDGLTIRAEAGSDHISFGLEAGFGTTSFACGATTDENYSYTGSRCDFTFSSETGPNLLTPSGRFVRFEIEDIDELQQRPFLSGVQPCYTETALLIDRIPSDQSVSGVIVDIRGPVGSFAQAEEIRALLSRIVRSGKKVYVFLENGGNAEYYVASCASRIWMHPSGSVSFIGLSSESLFLREFLDRIGIYPDLMHIGEYKSASDMLTRSDMSDAQRRATTSLLSSLQMELVAGVANGRGLEPAQLRRIMDTGPYTAERAVAYGMVDGVSFQDEVEELAREDFGRHFTTVSLEKYANSIPEYNVWGQDKHIAVVVATGYIWRGYSGSSFPFGRTMGSESICDALRAAASQSGVSAIVLRIDSPGGDALASDDMHHAVERIRENIPVIVSMGGVAASGGYYMACGADRIFADRMTITGSIGIISGKFSCGELLDSLGINVEEVSTGSMASMSSIFHPYTDVERSRAFDLLEDGYNRFVGTVASGRGMTFEEVDSIAQGRVWAGIDGVEIGIVDEIGGVVDAVHYAAGMSGMDPDEDIRVRIYPTPSFPGSIEMPGFGINSGILDLFNPEQILYLMQPIFID